MASASVAGGRSGVAARALRLFLERQLGSRPITFSEALAMAAREVELDDRLAGLTADVRPAMAAKLAEMRFAHDSGLSFAEHEIASIDPGAAWAARTARAEELTAAGLSRVDAKEAAIREAELYDHARTAGDRETRKRAYDRLAAVRIQNEHPGISFADAREVASLQASAVSYAEGVAPRDRIEHYIEQRLAPYRRKRA